MLVEGHDADAIFSALEMLDLQGLLVEAPATKSGQFSDAEILAFESQIELLADLSPMTTQEPSASSRRVGVEAQALLKHSLVAIIGLGIAGINLVHLLAAAGIGRILALPVDDTDIDLPPNVIGPHTSFERLASREELGEKLRVSSPALVVYCPDQFDESACEWFNGECLSLDVPLLPYRQDGLEVALGPLTVPRQTACYVCYRRRRDGAMPDWQEKAPATISGRMNFPLGVDWLAIEIIKFLAGQIEPVTRGRLIHVSYRNGLSQVHPVLKLPRCLACGVHRTKPSRKLWEL